ncbi:MAG: M23 family metallopeptidase, partial [Anaerolineae bacterium]|nr:M23 family metallopeptidase [Anaerolineae bacterium]
VILSAAGFAAPTRAQLSDVDGPPFSLPFAGTPGPTTWLYIQHYGNTTQAYNYGNVWYAAGQGLHFGVDFMAPCGTPVLAIADGVVTYVDADGFGAGPHNLVLDHPGTGLTSLYGHLVDQSLLVRGSVVQRGQQIGLSGDPDGSCESRPHLHLEIRSTDYLTAYNPLPFFDVNWHMLASIGPYNHNFQQDLDAPYRWMRIEDQPPVSFSGDIVNNYQHPWPPKLEIRAPENPPTLRQLDPVPENVTVTRAPVALDGWNLGAWWNPLDRDAVYLIDMVPGNGAGMFRQRLDGAPRSYVGPVPPPLLSPDGLYEIAQPVGDSVKITRVTDRASWEVFTSGNYPAISPGGSRLLWEVVHGEIVPGTSDPGVQVWTSDLYGNLPQLVTTFTGGYSLWLDDHRVLTVRRIQYTAETRLAIIDVDIEVGVEQFEAQPLGAYRWLSGLAIAPGGGRIVYYLAFQENSAASGLYVQDTVPGSTPQKLDFFGAYQWRDDRSLYTLSYDVTQDAHTLGVLDVITGEHRALTDPANVPIRVANGEWNVSPDGTRIVYVDPVDYGLYMLTVEP